MPDAARLPSVDDFKRNSLRGAPEFFRVGQTRSGQWWLVDPHGRGFLARAVAGVNQTGRIDAAHASPHGHPGHGQSHAPAPGSYAHTVAATFADSDHGETGAFARAAVRRLRQWHFNTLGAWAGPDCAGAGMYRTATLDFHRAGPVIHAGDARLPDVFDPAWNDAIHAHAAAACAPHRDDRELIGYFTDHELGWAQPDSENRPAPPAPDERPSLLQLCLSLEPSARAYHAAWEFVLAPRHGDLDALARDWGQPLPNKETLRQLTQAETPLRTPGYLRDQKRFTREFAHRYFSLSASAIRAHDPHHLILGCRFARHPGGTVLAECVYPHVDVVTAHPEDAAWEKTSQAYHAAGGMPFWLVGANWARDAFMRAPPRREPGGLTTIERMLRKGRLAHERLCAQRGVVGYEWSHWADAEGEEPPFASGLVHLDDREAREHTEALALLNARAERFRMKNR